MKQHDSYWKIWQSSNKTVTRQKIDEPIIVEWSGEETRLFIDSSPVVVFPFFQDSEESWYTILPSEMDGEMCEMYYDRENGVIYSTANDGVVEVLAHNIVFTQLVQEPPRRK